MIAVEEVTRDPVDGDDFVAERRLGQLGAQALAYLQKSTKVCETSNGNESCRDANSDQNALPWRIVAVGTFTLGDP